MKFNFIKKLEDIALDFYYYLSMPETIKIELKSDQNATIIQKQMFKIKLENPCLEYYVLDKAIIEKEIINNNWITDRGAYLNKESFEIFLFNEGEYEFTVSNGMKLGSAELKKISFDEWKQKWKK